MRSDRMNLHTALGHMAVAARKERVMAWVGRGLIPIFLLLTVCYPLRNVAASDAGLPTQGADASLRGVFFGIEGNPKPETAVGRLSIQLVKDGIERQVRLDHRFRSEDRFRFQVSSDRDGWLYILHRSADGEPQLLWPRLRADQKDEYLDANQVRAGITYAIPPKPGVFIFDEEVGTEFFYLVIRPVKKVPELSTIRPGGKPRPDSPVSIPQASQVSTESQANRIVQFSVRSAEDPVGPGWRGVLFDPGPQDADRNIYFSAHPEDDGKFTMIEFQLQHE